MRCYVAYRCGKLLEYWHNCDELRELKQRCGSEYSIGFSGAVQAIDGAAWLLYFLFQRPMFTETVNVNGL